MRGTFYICNHTKFVRFYEANKPKGMSWNLAVGRRAKFIKSEYTGIYEIDMRRLGYRKLGTFNNVRFK